MLNTVALGVAACATLLIVAVLFYLRWAHVKGMSKHYALAKLKLHRLPADSPTRLRIEAAQRLFLKGWKALKSKDPYVCLSFFAKAVEVDELGCGWRQQFEKKMEMIGDFFTLPPKDDLDKYQSMLAEAYLVVLLHTVVSLQGGQDSSLEEDYRVVKTRLDVCVSLQPNNPTAYKLRADLCQRFGHLANRTELMNDFQQAIKLLEDDADARSITCEGVDAAQQRKYLLAYCHHQLGSLQHRNKELDAAFASYTKAVEYSEPAFVNLADAHFSLCILTLLRARAVTPDTHGAVYSQAMHHYRCGLKAEQEALKYLPHVDAQVARSLAKELTKKFAKRVK